MKSLLIYTTYNARYQGFEPLFRLFAERNHPEADVVASKQEWNDHAYQVACMRFLGNPTAHDYTYYTDIDLLLMTEPIQLLTFHTSEMQSTGLCYSNSPRGKGERKGNERLTGLHFVNQDWFSKTQEVRARFDKLVKAGEYGNDREDDELMLYQIALGSGLKIPPKTKLVPRHHGMHLGSFRIYEDYTAKLKRKKLKRRFPLSFCNQYMLMVREAEGKAAMRVGLENEFSKWYLDQLHAFIYENMGQVVRT